MTNRIMTILSIAALMLATASAWAQVETWATYYQAKDGQMLDGRTIQTADGGYLVSASADYDAPLDRGYFLGHFLAKYGPAGGLQGYREIEGHQAVDVEEIRFFGFIIGYYVLSFSNIARVNNGDVNFAHAFALARLDAQGNLLWEKQYGYLPFHMLASEMIVDGSGITIAGMMYAKTGEMNADAWVVRTDLEGNLVWKNRYDHKVDEMAVSIAKVGNRGYVLAGKWDDDETDNSNIWVLELDDRGRVLKRRQFDSGQSDMPRDIVVADHTAGQEQYLLVGSSLATTKSYDVLAMRFDMNPDHPPMWSKVYRANAQGNGWGEGLSAILHETTPGNTELVIAGTSTVDEFNLDGLVMRLDPADGTLKWHQHWGGPGTERLTDIRPATSGNYLVTGTTTTFDTGDRTRIFSMGLTPDGLPFKDDRCWKNNLEMTTTSVEFDSDQLAVEEIPIALIVDIENSDVAIPDPDVGSLCEWPFP